MSIPSSIQFNSIQFNSIQFNSIQFNSIQFNRVLFASPSLTIINVFIASSSFDDY